MKTLWKYWNRDNPRKSEHIADDFFSSLYLLEVVNEEVNDWSANVTQDIRYEIQKMRGDFA